MSSSNSPRSGKPRCRPPRETTTRIPPPPRAPPSRTGVPPPPRPPTTRASVPPHPRPQPPRTSVPPPPRPPPQPPRTSGPSPRRPPNQSQTICLRPTNQGSASTSSASGPVVASKYNNRHEHKFEVKNYTKIYKCDGCYQEGSGERYRCDDCNKEFHRECRFFSKTQNRHEHKYNLMSYDKIFECDGCKEEGFGKRFRCNPCGNELHKECKFPKDSMHIKWLTMYVFKFQYRSRSERVCDACTKDIKGYFYYCADYVHPCGTIKRLDLHPCCINLNPILYAGLDGHVNKDEQRYTLTSKAPSRSKCYLCHKKKLKDTFVPGWSYVCGYGDYCYHVRCVREAMHEACVDIKTAIGKVSTSNHLVRNTSKWSDGILDGAALKIFKVILKMIVSTLLGDPTLGIVHVFWEVLFN